MQDRFCLEKEDKHHVEVVTVEICFLLVITLNKAATGFDFKPPLDD